MAEQRVEVDKDMAKLGGGSNDGGIAGYVRPTEQSSRRLQVFPSDTT